MLTSVKSTLAAGLFLTGSGLFFGLQPAPSQPESGKRVSVRFEEASFRQVAEWLEKQGLSFAIDKSEIDEEARVRLNANNVPVKDVLAALEKAWDGKWEKAGEMYVFKRSGPFAALRAWSSKDFPSVTIEPKDFDFKFEKLDPKTFDFKLGEIDPKLEKELGELSKRLAEKGAEMGRASGDEEKMQRLADEMAKLGEQMGKRAAELETKPEAGKIQPRLYRHATPKTPLVRPVQPTPPTPPLDAAKLIESITAAQWEKQKSRGYLTPEDLTPTQRKMLGNVKGTFEIRLKVDDREVVVKNK